MRLYKGAVTLALLFGGLGWMGGCGKKTEGAQSGGGEAAGAKVELHDVGPVGDPVAGAKVYAKVCIACHQKDGKGMGGMLAANFVDEKERLQKPDSVLLNSIAEGKKGKKAVMPPHKDVLSEQERKDALAYVRKTFGGSL